MKSQVSKNRGNFLRGEGTKQQQKKTTERWAGDQKHLLRLCAKFAMFVVVFFNPFCGYFY